ncbi:hypothetical protein SAY87_000699 [Trapa incisa]|uniref:Cytochrome P450 n=1 Tax=Trapa incisa TaxID=236973 RepID=A0AAN7GML1_9MYRT|nr:hypothetical protein SAY87_000699 [Trapa incisa]
MAAVAAEIFLAVALGGLLVAAVRVLDALVLRPRRMRLYLQRQGIGGPAPSFLLGNIPEMKRIGLSKPAAGVAMSTDTRFSHSWPYLLFPHLEQWRNEFGSIFMYSMGNVHLLSIIDADMVKELGLCTSLILGKPSYLTKDLAPLLGEGIITSSGTFWAHQRKIIAPELYLDKVKGMVNLMVDSTNLMLSSWESKINEAEGGSVEIDVDGDVRNLSAGIISRACFRSSYSQGKEIFLNLRQLQKVMSKRSIGIPGLRYLPTKENREMQKLEKDIQSKILEVVRQRKEAKEERAGDLLQMILEGAEGFGENEGLPSHFSLDRFIVDNCKNLYFAGHETTAVTALWSLVLLAEYPEWQDRARDEVLAVLGNGGIIDSDKPRSLKILTMIIQETL